MSVVVGDGPCLADVERMPSRRPARDHDPDSPARAVAPTPPTRASLETSDRDDARDGVDDSDAVTATGPGAVELAVVGSEAKARGKTRGKTSNAPDGAARRARRG